MTTPIHLEDVRKNPQDCLVDGLKLKSVSISVYWVDAPGVYQSAPIEVLINGGRITRKPKKRKIKVRPWISQSGFLHVWSSPDSIPAQDLEKGSPFSIWAGPEQEIEVTDERA